MPVYRRKYKDPETNKIRLGNFYFKFTVDGVTYKETVKTARTTKQAEEAERRARGEVHDGVYGHKGKRRLFAEFAEKEYLVWAEQHHRDIVNERLRVRVLADYFTGRTLAQVSQIAVERFKIDYLKTPTRHEQQRSPRTVNNVLATLSCVLSRAVELKYLRENVCMKVRKLAVEEFPYRRLTAEEEEVLLSAAELGPEFLRPMIRLALWSGFRQCELIELRRAAVDFARNRVYVVNPKWKRDPRKTEGNPMSAEVRELLSELCGGAVGEHLFVDGAGNTLNRSQVDFAFRQACRRAGISGFRFHDLRHEYGSRLGDADVNLKKIARLMGHSDTKMTERYVHPDEDSLLAATEVAARPRSRIVPRRLRVVG